MMTVVCIGTRDVLKSKLGTASESSAKTHWTKADVIQIQTHPNDNSTYGLFISCFARSTQIGLMYHHNPHNTKPKLLSRPTAKWSLPGAGEVVTLWFSLTESGLSWLGLFTLKVSHGNLFWIWNQTQWVLLLLLLSLLQMTCAGKCRGGGGRWGIRCWRMA